MVNRKLVENPLHIYHIHITRAYNKSFDTTYKLFIYSVSYGYSSTDFLNISEHFNYNLTNKKEFVFYIESINTILVSQVVTLSHF